MPPRSTLVSTAVWSLTLGIAIATAIAWSALAAAPSESGSGDLFARMASVMRSPRCLNCHTSDPFPRQGEDGHRHIMNVARGSADRGAPGLGCATCHQAANVASTGVPGAPDWRLAPLRMGWDRLTVGELCRAISDPAHGAMAPGRLAAHFDSALVRWAWSPGADLSGHPRTVPPIPHDAFVRLTQRWVASGAACPP